MLMTIVTRELNGVQHDTYERGNQVKFLSFEDSPVSPHQIVGVIPTVPPFAYKDKIGFWCE